MSEVEAPARNADLCACGCGRHHVHTVFRVIDGNHCFFVSMPHLQAFEMRPRVADHRVSLAAEADLKR